MTIMNSSMPMRFRLRNGGYIGLPIMFLSLKAFVAPSGATTTLDINLVNGSENASGNGAIRSGGITGGGGVGAFAST